MPAADPEPETAAPPTVEPPPVETPQRPLDLSLPKDLDAPGDGAALPPEQPRLPNVFDKNSAEKRTRVGGKVLVDEDSPLGATAVEGGQLTIERRID